MKRIIELFEDQPVAFVVNDGLWLEASNETSSLRGFSTPKVVGDVQVFTDHMWDDDKVGAFFSDEILEAYKDHRAKEFAPRKSLRSKTGGCMMNHPITSKIRYSGDGPGPPWEFITEPIKGGASVGVSTEKITVQLKPEFAVYVLSSLEVIREVLDGKIDRDASMNVKSRAAAIEVLCSEIAHALDEQASREKIDDIITDLIDRYTQ